MRLGRPARYLPQRRIESTANNFADAQPESHLVSTRRQPRRDSPSSTIESGRMIPTMADLPFASARTFTQVVAFADTNSVEPAVRVGLDNSAAVLVGPTVAPVAARGAGGVDARARVSEAIPDRIPARCVDLFANDGTTATEARRGTGASCSVITLGAGESGALAGRSCHPPQLAAMVRTATTTFPVHRGIGDRATAGHQRQPSREAG